MGGNTKTVVVGELDGAPSARLDRIVEVWKGQGVDASHDILAALWTGHLREIDGLLRQRDDRGSHEDDCQP